MVLYRQHQTRKKRHLNNRSVMRLRFGAAMATAVSPDVVTQLIAVLYVLSGICQPLLMTVCKHAGLADSSAQLYMLFYYLGPAGGLLIPPLLKWTCGTSSQTQRQQNSNNGESSISTIVIVKASLVAIFDIVAQSFNYTGASAAGATIFAMIYSSVTIWTAIFSRCLLHRTITRVQCFAILVVFGGLCITSLDSISLGSDVVRGTIYILIGSCMHGATYVLSEAIMATSHERSDINHNDSDSTTSGAVVVPTVSTIVCDPRPRQKREQLTFMENSGIQGMVACIGLLFWQMVYTIPHWDELIRQPTQIAGTTFLQAVGILLAFSMANLLHSVSFYYTVAHYPGGATSAGVMKGLQAVLVFVAAHLIYCNRINDTTMCFTTMKFISLVTVVGGVAIFRWGGSNFLSNSPTISKVGYTTI